MTVPAGLAIPATVSAHDVPTDAETYDKLAYNTRTRAFFEALRRGLINSDELEKAERELADWIERDRRKYSKDKDSPSN